MQRMREVIRGSLARSLRRLPEEDRLAAALPLVCGTALAAHCEVASLDRHGTLHLLVDGPEWLGSLLGMRDLVQHDLQRVAGVPLAGLHFQQAGTTPGRGHRPSPSDARGQPETETQGNEARPLNGRRRPA